MEGKSACRRISLALPAVARDPEMCIKTVLTQSIFVCAADIDHRKLSRKACHQVIGPAKKLCEEGGIIVLGKVSRLIVSASFAAILAGCNSLGVGGGDSATAPAQPNGNAQIMPMAPANPSSNNASIGTAKTASGNTAPVVQGACPQIFMKDKDAIFRTYAGGAKTGDADKLAFQASIGDYTRQCSLNDANLTMTVVAQLRVLAGPNGSPGKVTLPVRITVFDGEDALYSEVTNFPVEVGSGATQALFRKDGIKLPVGSGSMVRVNIGFDQGPVSTKKKKA
ncbi:hypothetical protein AF71_00039310 [Rhizobium sp. 57MFTsu3.2]|nr:hypothetical protein [Rhizobium sp. 57MFTsu3.2]